MQTISRNTSLFDRENDITGVIDSVFTVQHEVFGEMKTFELKPGGSDIPVTQENKKEYAKYKHAWINNDDSVAYTVFC
jgi:hypothetical protein